MSQLEHGNLVSLSAFPTQHSVLFAIRTTKARTLGMVAVIVGAGRMLACAKGRKDRRTG